MNSTAVSRSAGARWSTLFTAKKTRGTRSSVSRTSSRSPRVSGCSAVSTKSAASTCGRKARAASVLWPWIEPIPGVSTSWRPEPSRASGASIVVRSTPSRFSGLRGSVAKSASRSTGCSSSRPSRKRTSSRSVGPWRSTVTTEVSGTTPTGSRSRPTSAFTSVLLPRLNSPSTTRLKRPRASRSRASSRSRRALGRTRPSASATSSSAASRTTSLEAANASGSAISVMASPA